MKQHHHTPDNTPPQPPPWLLRFFRWFCHPDFVEDIEGDLLERYYDRLFKCWRHHWLLVEGLLADWPGALSFLCPHCQSKTIATPEMDGEGQFVPLLCPVCEHSIEWESLGIL